MTLWEGRQRQTGCHEEGLRWLVGFECSLLFQLKSGVSDVEVQPAVGPAGNRARRAHAEWGARCGGGRGQGCCGDMWMVLMLMAAEVGWG